MKPGKPLQRRTPMPPPTSGLRRRTELQRSAASAQPGARSTLGRKAPMKQTPPEPKLTPQQHARLVERSGGWCELRQPGVCVVVAHDAAHRIGEGMGGRHGAAAEENDRLSNVLHACRYCHEWCHHNRTEARGHGWMLRNGDNPLAEPVWWCGRWVLLDDEGGHTPHHGEEVA